MIIDPSEVDDFERHVELVCEVDRLARDGIETNSDDLQTPLFVADRPHLLMSLGFDEFRALETSSNGFGPADESQSFSIPELVDWAYGYEVFFRQEKSGHWAWFDGISDHARDKNFQAHSIGTPHAHFIGNADAFIDGFNSTHAAGHTQSNLFLNLNDHITKLRKLTETADQTPRRLIFAGLWTPKIQLEQRIALAHSVDHILSEIGSNASELHSVTWRQLEEIVAELLRSQGMKVSVTDPSNDGGRDIVARGELIPGEPMVLAVEVKKKPVVGLYDVQRALRANEDCPALLVATSGRFSAGVIREKSRHRNQLRLYLKDGIALNQWIAGWARKRNRSINGEH